MRREEGMNKNKKDTKQLIFKSLFDMVHSFLSMVKGVYHPSTHKMKNSSV